MSARRQRIRLEDLLGRKVRTNEGTVVGRIEEVRAERHGDEHEVVEYLIGSGALLERWGLSPLLVGRKRSMLVARWDQLDVRRPDRPMLTCPVAELEKKD